MNKFLKFFLLISIPVLLASCQKDDTPEVTPLRDFAEQAKADNDSLEKFFVENYMTVDANYNVNFTKIPVGGTQTSIKAELDPNLKLRDTLIKEKEMQNGVEVEIEYLVHFIKFREGTQKRPTQVDSVHVAYRGVTFNNTQFDVSQNPIWFKLEEVITGWGHIIPNFKTGTYNATPGPNPVTYDGYGAGVMFLPSGLAYYSGSVGSIGTYTPIIFSFKLYELQYRDQDGDGIKSKDERPDIPSGITAVSTPINLVQFYKTNWTNNPFKYDSDGDGIPNMYDIDDDGDGFLTKTETLEYTDAANNKKYYYKYNAPAAFDNLATPNINESHGIPARSITLPYTYDHTTQSRLRKHLDKNWTPLN